MASFPCILAHRPPQRQRSARGTRPGPQSIPLDIPQDGQQMVVALDREALESPLIQMPVSYGPMRDPPTHGVRVRQPTEEVRDLTVGLRPDDEVPVVGQDAVRQDANRMSLMRLDHDALKRLEVGILVRRGASCRPIDSAHDRPARRVRLRAVLGMGETIPRALMAIVNTSCVPVSSLSLFPSPFPSPSMATFGDFPGFKCRPHPPHDSV